jgi:hypothetical protein
MGVSSRFNEDSSWNQSKKENVTCILRIQNQEPRIKK